MTQTLNLTDSEIYDLWSAGDDAGNGYAVGGGGMTPREAAESPVLFGVHVGSICSGYRRPNSVHAADLNSAT